MTDVEHGQGYQDSGRPMTLQAEVWPVAADETGLWLLEDGRPSLPVMDDAEPHNYAEMELMQAGMVAATRVLHSTSWRVDYDRDELALAAGIGRNYLVVTYLAVVECPGLVRESWPEAVPITLAVADAELGHVPTHGPAQAPAVRHLDVLFHGLRHLRFLLEHDATIAAALSKHWRQHLAAFEPAIARMYERVHSA
jgi:hypothetical protein